ncbi:MAG: hypothetical protein JWP25_5589, partial [Bradyrhizobium sp.]|nr:hypothetical protein [Bradyrhizobium sp.]
LTLNGHEERISPVMLVIPTFCLDVQFVYGNVGTFQPRF